jgi:hypothetical protein
MPRSCLLTCLHHCNNNNNNICYFRSWYEKFKQDFVHILGIIIGKYRRNRQRFLQQLARAEAYFLIMLYVTLLYLLLWRRVKKYISYWRKMDNYADRDVTTWGLRGWGLRHGKQYKKTLLTTYQSPSVSNLEAVKLLLAWSSFLPCWCSGIYLFIYFFTVNTKCFPAFPQKIYYATKILT